MAILIASDLKADCSLAKLLYREIAKDLIYFGVDEPKTCLLKKNLWNTPFNQWPKNLWMDEVKINEILNIKQPPT